ncbi:hypothetical protein ABE425_15555 [Chryseobacterium cucumeris]|uniref:hypothetical protein n=1 Tax=Chryseobacterium TaxID=59732 RepID=UPI002882E8C8|nr:hypothetical protein [Chryseobacterium sp. SG20098]WNI36463.1 hypothetical protein RHP76_21345 [Chryseobacterium sp. SG20098]
MKKKLFKLSIMFFTSSLAYCQVGINTTNPYTTLDIVAKTNGAKPEGILIPRLTGDQIKSMESQLSAYHNSMMIYATSASVNLTGSAIDITSPGFYYYNFGLAKWVAVNNGGTASKIPISGLIDGTANNSIDSKNFEQTWNWNTADIQTPLTLKANALTTGTLLEIASANPMLNSTNGLVRIFNNALPTTATGIFARLQPSNIAGSGISLLNNGNSGFGTTAPTAKIHVSESGITNQAAAIISQASSAADTGSLNNTGSKGLFIDMSSNTLDRALVINQNGTATNSRGLNITMGSTNPGLGGFINHTGTGEGFRIQNNNLVNNNAGIYVLHSGAGNGIYSTTSLGSSDATTAVSNKRAGIWGNRIIGSTAGNNAGSGYAGPNSTAVTSAHTSVYGSMGNATTIATTDSYIFGILGEVLSVGGAAAVDRSGGVLGNSQASGTFGILGYRTSASANAGVYGSAAMSSGTGRFALGSDATGFGVMGIGDLMGAAFRGNIYGINTSGSRYGMYIDGATYTNNIIANVSVVDKNTERITTYVPTSTTADIYTRGTVTLDESGRASVTFDKNFSDLVSDNSIVVTITPIGRSSKLYLENEPTKSGFIVKTDDYSTGKFSYIAVGTRKDFEKISVPKEILAKDYDENMTSVLHNEFDTSSKGKPIHWNGSELKFERSSDSGSNSVLNIAENKIEKIE